MDSADGLQTSLWRGCPIRILRDQRSHAAPPERFAGLRVLRRPSAPRHPPRTLSRLCSPVCVLAFPLLSSLPPSPLSLSTPLTPLSLSSASLLSSCLGKIEVIMLFGL